MKNLALVIVALLVLILIYLSFGTKQEVRAPILDSTGELPSSLSFNLKSQNDSGRTGSVIIEPVTDGLEISLNLDGVTEGDSEMAQVHRGNCAEIGEALYPLMNIDNGQSVTLLPLTIADLRSQLPLVLNIETVGAEGNSSVACGEISF